METSNTIYNLFKKVAIIFSTLFITFFSCFSQKEIESKFQFLNKSDSSNALVLKIDFQKNFNHDTIRLKINGHPIFNQVVISSSKIVEFADFSVYVFLLNNNHFKIYSAGNTDTKTYYKKEKIKISEKNLHSIQVSIGINENDFDYNFDLNKSKYIGLSKSINDSLEFLQSDRDFIYD
jgi:hypothetical protein